MRVADFIAERLKVLGCTDVYMVTGGAAMHLNDAFAKAFGSHVHCLHHEQSCAIAAESFARITGRPCIVNVTAGPGGINAINGVFGAYVDSIPMIVVSGQAKRETLLANCKTEGLRQLGDQEVDIVRMVSGICKTSLLIQDPLQIHQAVDHAYQLATSGRPGPVWLDVPIDVQATPLPASFEALLVGQQLSLDSLQQVQDPEASEQELMELASHLLRDERPVLYVGSGIRQAGAYEEFLSFLEAWPLATVTGWNSNDLLWDDHPCYSGRPGSVGNRAGNFAVQYAGAVLTVGCRLNIRQVSFNWKSFAKNAWTCHLDIDPAELNKPTLASDLKIRATCKGFLPRLSKALADVAASQGIDLDRVKSHWQAWREWLKLQLQTYTAVSHALPSQSGHVNPYRLIDRLTQHLPEGATTVCADGTACVVGFQAAVFKRAQRMFHNSGCASMGYDLPAAIGAYHATQAPVTCLAGDGSIMMNLQELAFIGGKQLPIKIVLLNNLGYHSIRQTQNNYFPDNPVGCGAESGLPFPKFSNLCQGFELDYGLLDDEQDLQSAINELYANDRPALLEVILDLRQEFAPKLASKKLADGSMVTAELEDMSPLLGDETMAKLQAVAMAIR
jgi:acetolactate synthase-1/2/3 large subunit